MSMGIGIRSSARTLADFLWQHRDKRITINEAYVLLQKSQPGIGKATIYRMYHLLMELGFAQRLKVGDGLFRYEIYSQNSVHTQQHLICSECGSVQDVREDMLDEMERQIEEKYGFTVADHGCSFLAAVTAAKPENTEANKCKRCHIGN
ncbi:MAG: transcriptional repressor [Clostridium sp.]|nr:transcriptional repressor [Clostridium sp.]